ncbi:hypothetical protein LPJ53_002172 [Coemansia erecta]|uniref:Uncharacterized protein n=1 Tax=Coemansia erecta TaxID=147472 RepID=A0A9W7XYM0_9FUNG|nr:hypothetical protein LPJ53_002172 [Coemansia erecta]
MKLSVLSFSALSTAVISVQAAVIRAATPTLHIFGDSLSDIGTLKQITLGLVPAAPYWEGRFSSGPVWNEYMAELLGFNLYNKAIGGSTSDNSHSTLIDILNINIPSTQDQINYFKFTNPFYTLDSTRSQDIVVLEVGANDYFADMADLKNGTLSASSFIDTLSTTVVDQLDQLRAIGFKNIVVANLAAIQYTPMAGQNDMRDLAASIVNTYNQQLATKSNSWIKSVSGVSHFAIADIGGFVELTVNSPAIISALGLTDVADACVDSLNLTSLSSLLSSTASTSADSACADPSTYYFFDSVHPAERVHRLYGYYAWKQAIAILQGTTYDLTEANMLSLINQYNLGTVAPKPATV